MANQKRAFSALFTLTCDARRTGIDDDPTTRFTYSPFSVDRLAMSYAHSRASTASQVPPSLAHVEGIDQLTPSQVRLLEKQQEYHGLLELRRASLSMLERMEELARMSSVMADGGEAIGSVLRNWPHVFSILNLFRESSCLCFNRAEYL